MTRKPGPGRPKATRWVRLEGYGGEDVLLDAREVVGITGSVGPFVLMRSGHQVTLGPSEEREEVREKLGIRVDGE